MHVCHKLQPFSGKMFLILTDILHQNSSIFLYHPNQALFSIIFVQQVSSQLMLKLFPIEKSPIITFNTPVDLVIKLFTLLYYSSCTNKGPIFISWAIHPKCNLKFSPTFTKATNLNYTFNYCFTCASFVGWINQYSTGL